MRPNTGVKLSSRARPLGAVRQCRFSISAKPVRVGTVSHGRRDVLLAERGRVLSKEWLGPESWREGPPHFLLSFGQNWVYSQREGRLSCCHRDLPGVFGQYVVGAFPLATDVGLGYASGEVRGRFTCRFDGEKVSGDVNPRAVLVSRTWLRSMAGVWYAAGGSELLDRGKLGGCQ